MRIERIRTPKDVALWLLDQLGHVGIALGNIVTLGGLHVADRERRQHQLRVISGRTDFPPIYWLDRVLDVACGVVGNAVLLWMAWRWVTV